MALPALLAALGSAASGPLGQSLIGALAPSLMGGMRDWFKGPQAQVPEQIAQQGLLQQLQQPFQLGSAQRQQQLLNQFNQEIIPGLAERFSGMGSGGQRSGAFRLHREKAGGDLMTNLGALQEQNALEEAKLNQGRLGQLGGYLGGQQELGLQAQQLGQRGTLANQEAMLRALGLMQGQQGTEQERLGAYGNILGGLAGGGMGQQFDILRHGGRPGNWKPIVGGMVEGVKAAKPFYGG